MEEQGVEILDHQTIEMVARKVKKSWPKLAHQHLGFNIEDCQNIKKSITGQREQASYMLAVWRQRFNGAYPLKTLSKALQALDPELAYELGPLKRIPSLCTTCGNSDPVKFRRYSSRDGQSRLLGICCTECDQEWLRDRFLLHPDTDGTRPRVRLCGVVLKKQLKVTMEMDPAFQVKSSREKIDLDYALSVLKVGDHIAWQRPYGIWHHAIVTGVDKRNGLIIKVIHWTKVEDVMQIQESDINIGGQSGELYRLVYEKKIKKANSLELVIARAKSRLWDTGYKLVGDNCETFATYCKTGVKESCQVRWLYNKVILSAVATLAKMFAERFFLVESVGTLINSIVMVTTELVLRGCYRKRKQGGLSRRDFVKTSTQRVVESMCGATLNIKCGFIAGQAAGAAVGTFFVFFTGTAIGEFIGSIVGGVIGSCIGSVIGAPIGLGLASCFCDDRAVRINELRPGDQIVSYDNLFHPRHHAIVVSRTQGKRKVTVVHSSTFSNGVVEEEIDFIKPVYRVIYQEQNCFLPEKVIERARSKIVARRRTRISTDTTCYCKHFAQWCKLKKYK